MAIFRRRHKGPATEIDHVSSEDRETEEGLGLAVHDNEVGTFQTFHLIQTPERKEGPYYIAPDSAEPLPDAIWKDLDPTIVEAEVKSLNQLNEGRGLDVSGDIDSATMDFLEEDDDLGRQVIRLLQSGSVESASELLDDE